jgi:GntR family transcriptional regulator
MSLAISLSPASDVPIFRQIMQQVHRAVSMGRLSVGEQLPVVRVLAEELVINPNTVARAYQELIREGVLESRSGRGVFVTVRRQIFSNQERTRRLQHAAEQYCHDAILLGSELPEIRTILEAKWKQLRRETHVIENPEERKKK